MTGASVIIAAGGRWRSLPMAVESMVRQSSPASEIVVVETSGQAVPALMRLRLSRAGARFTSAASESPGALWNAGIGASRASRIVLLDPEDGLEPSYLEQAAAALEAAPDLAFVTAWTREPGGREVRCPRDGCDLPGLLGHPGLVHASSMFRRDVWGALGGFDETLAGYELYDFWLRLLEQGYRGAVIEEPLLSRAAGSEVPTAARPPVGRLQPLIEPLLTKHRPTYVRHLTAAVLGRELRLGELRSAAVALHARKATIDRELSELKAEVATATGLLRALGRARVDWGDLRRTTPISPVWGADRGRCVDRYYIEQFLEAHADDIRGDVLEVYDSDYTVRFGGRGVRRSDVIDIDPTNPRATVIADLRRADAIPTHAYDCFIMTQTLHVIYEMGAVLRECARILKPGGVLLATLPCASRIAPEQGLDGDFWRFTPAAARSLFSEFFPPERLEVRAYGNVLVNIAFQYGLACEDLTQREFETHDPYFPLLISVRARTSGAGRVGGR
jgi:hypothetical protein